VSTIDEAACQRGLRAIATRVDLALTYGTEDRVRMATLRFAMVSLAGALARAEEGRARGGLLLRILAEESKSVTGLARTTEYFRRVQSVVRALEDRQAGDRGR